MYLSACLSAPINCKPPLRAYQVQATGVTRINKLGLEAQISVSIIANGLADVCPGVGVEQGAEVSSTPQQK